jgi:hypothetical protein
MPTRPEPCGSEPDTTLRSRRRHLAHPSATPDRKDQKAVVGRARGRRQGGDCNSNNKLYSEGGWGELRRLHISEGRRVFR